MKKFIFTLQKVLELRESIENNEKNKLSALYEHQKQLHTEKEELRKRFQKARLQQQKAYDEGVPAASLMQYPDYFLKIRQQSQELENRIVQINEQIKSQISVVLQATQNKEILVKLKEKQLIEYQAAQKKADEKFIEEFVSYQMIANPV